MGDRAAASLQLYAIPAGHEAAAAEVLEEHGLRDEYTYWNTERDPMVTARPGTYMDDEAALDVVDEAGAALVSLGCTFWLAQDAKYEWSGSGCLYAPGIGRWDGKVDQDGNPMLDAYAVDAAVDAWRDDGADVEDLVRRLEGLSGRAVREHLLTLREVLEAAEAARNDAQRRGAGSSAVVKEYPMSVAHVTDSCCTSPSRLFWFDCGDGWRRWWHEPCGWFRWVA